MKTITTIILLCAGGVALSACSDPKKMCLPKGEKGTVLRTGSAEGYRFATIRRENGDEVTCTGKTSTVVLQPGDVIDGQNLTRASATGT